MSKLFSELTQEAQAQQEILSKQAVDIKKTDTATSVSDTANRRLSKKVQSNNLQTDKLQTIIAELSEISVATHGTPVRLSTTEKQDIEDFIYVTLRKKGLQGKSVSGAKLMRYALRYMIKVQPDVFVAALAEALTKEEKLSI